MSLFTERMTPVILFAPSTDGTTTAATASTILDLQSYGADSVYIAGIVGETTSTAGFSITLQASATTASFAALCTPGTTVAMTAATTVTNRILQIDAKNVNHRYINVLSNTSAAVLLGGVVAWPYDSKKQVVTASSDVATTVAVVNPTTTV